MLGSVRVRLSPILWTDLGAVFSPISEYAALIQPVALLTGIMHQSRSQRPAHARHVDDIVGKDVRSLNPRSAPSNLSLRTLYDEQEASSIKDPEKYIKPVVLTDEYTGHADEPPDGGLKAWSVILGYVLPAFCVTRLWYLPTQTIV